MTERQVIVTQGRIDRMTWTTGTKAFGGAIRPTMPACFVWLDNALYGVSTDPQAALLDAERLARRLGLPVVDAILETTDEPPAPWVPPGAGPSR